MIKTVLYYYVVFPLVLGAVFVLILLGAQAFDSFNTRTFGAIESPDGTEIAVVRKTNSRPNIFIVNKATGESTQLTRDGLASSPAWFPDGKRIAWSCSTKQGGVANICVTILTGGTTTRLTNDVSYDSDPSVSPDGEKIVFSRGFSGKRALFVLDIQSGKIESLPSSSVTDGHSPQWSPVDQSTILFTSLVNGSPHLYLMDKTTTVHLGVGENGIWSPDGKQIVFSRTQPCGLAATCTDTYIMDADGSRAHPFSTPSKPSSWSADGSTIYSTSSFGAIGVIDREWVVGTRLDTGLPFDIPMK